MRRSLAESGSVESHGGAGDPTCSDEGEYRLVAMGESALLGPHGAAGDPSRGLPLGCKVFARCIVSGLAAM